MSSLRCQSRKAASRAVICFRNVEMPWRRTEGGMPGGVCVYVCVWINVCALYPRKRVEAILFAFAIQQVVVDAIVIIAVKSSGLERTRQQLRDREDLGFVFSKHSLNSHLDGRETRRRMCTNSQTKPFVVWIYWAIMWSPRGTYDRRVEQP